MSLDSAKVSFHFFLDVSCVFFKIYVVVWKDSQIFVIINNWEIINSYSFVFSPRPGTPASNLDIIDTALSKKRLKAFQEISEKIKTNYRKKLIGKQSEVLFENKLDGEEKYFGRDKYGDSVLVESKINLTGKILNVKINDFNQNTFFAEAIFSNKSGAGGSIGIGFAVPSNMVKTVVDSVEKGKVIRPWLGATGQTIDSDLAREFGLKRPAGVIINEVYPESSAVDSGLKPGDIVLSIDNKSVEDRDVLRYRIATLALGKTFSMEVIRNGKPAILRFKTKAPLTKPQPNTLEVTGRNPFNGAVLANLSPAFALDNGLDDMKRGVVIVRSRRGSVAERLGLKKGDIGLTINSKKISFKK